MIKEINWLGPLVTDTKIPGERKEDGIIPAHPGILRLSRNRWMLFIATLDPSGWDATKSILYQIRANSPCGPVIREALLAASEEGWDPFGRGEMLSKRRGMANGFGVPKGAVKNGRSIKHNNIFVAKWYRIALIRQGNKLVNHFSEGQGKRPDLVQKTLRVEWLQFRLNDREDDIEILQQPRTLMQKGYGSEDEFSSLGTGFFMNHAMTPPVHLDDEGREWVEFIHVGLGPDAKGHVAPVRYRFNDATGLYEWVQTGNPIKLPGRLLSEPSTLRYRGGFITAFRDFVSYGRTCWYRTDDPFGDLGEPKFSQDDEGPTWVPRHAYACPDGAVRLLGNNIPAREVAPPAHARNPLYIWDVDPETFRLANRRVVADAFKEGLPFADPFCDHSKMCPPQGDRQLIVYRSLDHRQTSMNPKLTYTVPPDAHRCAGIYHAEIVYHEEWPEDWF